MKLLTEELAFMVKAVDMQMIERLEAKCDTSLDEGLVRMLAEVGEELILPLVNINHMHEAHLRDAIETFRSGRAAQGPTFTEIKIAKALMEKIDTRNGFIVFWKGKQYPVYSDTVMHARTKFCQQNRIPHSKEYLVRPMLAERDGEQVVHKADF